MRGTIIKPMKLKKEQKYYNYIYAHPLTGEVFYVGKGSGNRSEGHIREVKKGRLPNGRNYKLYLVIKDLLKEELQPMILRIAFFSDEKLAYENEVKLIKEYKKRGCHLLNITDGGDGASGSSLEFRKARKKLAKKMWADKEYRARFTKIFNDARNNPEIQKKRIEKLKAFSNDPEVKKKFIENARKYAKSKENRERVSKEAKERWGDPKFKKEVSIKISKSLKGNPKVSEARKRLWANPEHRLKMKQMMNEKWQDPEYVKKVMASRKKTMSSETYKKRQSEQMKTFWDNPDNRIKRLKERGIYT